ncbi:MAG TPA: type II secretion system protein GspL [Burkholderiales bacterium]
MRLTHLHRDGWFDLAAAWRSKAGGDRLELWLPRGWPDEDRELRWRRVASAGAAREGSQRGLEGLAPAEEIVVWTPAAETLLVRAKLPTRSASKIAQALPYALEEQLIEPPERLHFAFAQEADGALAVAVTSRERMDRWLSALAAAGLPPTHLAPVSLSLPLADRAWTLAFAGGEIALRSGPRAGLGGSIESQAPAWLHAALAEARGESSAPQRILLVDAPAEIDSAAWSAALGLPVEPMRRGEGAVPAAPLNLLQQRYAQRGRGSTLWRAFVPAAALLAAWLVVALAFDAVEWARLSRAARAADEDMRALLVKSFPETRAILDPAEQMRRGLEDLSVRSGAAGPGDLLSLLARVAPAVESRVRVQSIEYTDRSLLIRFVATEPDSESLARTLRARSLEVELERSGNEARLRVRAAATPSPQGKS